MTPIKITPETPEVQWLCYANGEPRTYSDRYALGNPYTGSIASGWCLYQMRGSCWNQVTKAAHPPVAGAKPEYIEGKWYWIDQPAAPTERPGEDKPCTCHPDDNPPSPCARKYALSACKATPPASDTPMTDAESYRTAMEIDGGPQFEIVDADFARTLERSLTAARKRGEELEDALRLCRNQLFIDGEDVNGWLIDIADAHLTAKETK